MDVITSQELEISTVLDVMSVRIYSMITKTYKLTLVVNIPECENPLGLLQYWSLSQLSSILTKGNRYLSFNNFDE